MRRACQFVVLGIITLLASTSARAQGVSEVVRALTGAGIPVFAQFGLTPQTAAKFGVPYSAQNSPQVPQFWGLGPGAANKWGPIDPEMMEH